MYRKGLSAAACWSRCINPSALRVLGHGSSKDGSHSSTAAFLPCTHSKLSDFVCCEHPCLFICYFWCLEETMLTSAFNFLFIIPEKVE